MYVYLGNSRGKPKRREILGKIELGLEENSQRREKIRRKPKENQLILEKNICIYNKYVCILGKFMRKTKKEKSWVKLNWVQRKTHKGERESEGNPKNNRF